MKRVTSAALEAKAAETGQPIEFDNDAGIAVLVIGATTYYAALEGAPE